MNKVYVGIDKSKSFRVYLTISNDLVEDARKAHGTSPLATAALGRALTGTGLMGLMMKNEEGKITVQFKGDGPAQEILVTADVKGNVKGYISNPAVDLPLNAAGKLDVGGAIGIGTLTVIKDLGMKEPYLGRIDLVSGEIAEDLAMYFFLSEQQSTSVALGVLVDVDGSVKASGGMIIQLLPEATETVSKCLEDTIDTMMPLTSIIDQELSNAQDENQEILLEKIANRIFVNMPEEYQVEKLDMMEMDWNCDCSLERLEKVLISLGKEELTAMKEEDGHAELVCQFCTKKYHFSEQDLNRIIDSIS